MKKTGKIVDITLYGLTHTTANRCRRTSINTSLDFSKNIYPPGHKLHKGFNENTSFKLSISCMPILQAKTTDGYNEEYLKANRLQKQNYVTV